MRPSGSIPIKSRKTKSREAQESILQEIEKLAAEAYSIFRSSMPTYTDTDVSEDKDLQSSVTISSGLVRDMRFCARDLIGSPINQENGIWSFMKKLQNYHPLGRGNKSSGDNFHAAPNIDHSQDFVRKDIKEWLRWLREEIGYDGWRLDFVRGFWGGYVKDYLESSEPYFAVGEFWDSLSYTYGEMDHNQDAHRQRIVDWINATNGTAGAFDVTTKGILHAALERCEYWRLSDEKGKPPGVVGWWPSRAVTFIENHDTGSTQGHWRFPGGKEMQGYAYILTHPGTPSVFYDHIFSEYQSQILTLISIRKRKRFTVGAQ
ncbi:hypothetical protein DH2020_003455 [Rehmannia glutinosa]|uniref:1,4-alpha-D-glucan glucanohydrolase n=1 Tax=Rehmannia glutinosa TaxID=99300 RepID=A0ABR0XLU2_REHGL